METIAACLKKFTQQLAPHVSNPAMEVRCLLRYVLGVSQATLWGFAETPVEKTRYDQLVAFVARRALGEPMAYLVGEKEFWSLSFKVSADTLIPRCETELLVSLALRHRDVEPCIIADLGTGSGAVAVAIASERPHWMIEATDIDGGALLVAKENAQRHDVKNVHFTKGNWCEALSRRAYHMILANPPYIQPADPCLTQDGLPFEPYHALVAENAGLAAIEAIISAAKPLLVPSSGQLMLEHGCTQAEVVRRCYYRYGFSQVQCFQDVAGLDRVSVGIA